MIKIIDISDKGRKQSKKLKYEVGLFHTDNAEEAPEIVAKFRSYGDGMSFAYTIANGNCYYASILVRS